MMAWSDEARQAAADARKGSGGRAVPFDRSKIGLTVGAQFTGRQLGNNQPKSEGARAVTDLRAALALGQGHPKSRTW